MQPRNLKYDDPLGYEVVGRVLKKILRNAFSMQRNKPPPTEEELAERERLFQESREEEYAAMRAENAKIREQDLEKKAEVILLSLLYPSAFPMVWRAVSSVSHWSIFDCYAFQLSQSVDALGVVLLGEI